MRFIAHYIYFRFFRFAKIFSKTTRYGLQRASFTSSLMIFFNVAVILDLIEVGVTQDNVAYFSIAFMVWYLIIHRYFFNASRYRRVMTQFRNEDWVISILGSVIVLIYIIASIVLFAMSFSRF